MIRNVLADKDVNSKYFPPVPEGEVAKETTEDFVAKDESDDKAEAKKDSDSDAEAKAIESKLPSVPTTEPDAGAEEEADDESAHVDKKHKQDA